MKNEHEDPPTEGGYTGLPQKKSCNRHTDCDAVEAEARRNALDSKNATQAPKHNWIEEDTVWFESNGLLFNAVVKQPPYKLCGFLWVVRLYQLPKEYRAYVGLPTLNVVATIDEPCVVFARDKDDDRASITWDEFQSEQRSSKLVSVADEDQKDTGS